jgi:hypothetical protein
MNAASILLADSSVGQYGELAITHVEQKIWVMTRNLGDVPV